MRPPHDTLWITDPWETLAHGADTTLRLIEEARTLGVECFWASVRSIRWSPSGTELAASRVRRVEAARGALDFELARAEWLRPRDFARIFYRTDPPVDLAYLQPLALLEADAQAGASNGGGDDAIPEIVNPPSVLRGLGEKLLASGAPELMPPSLVASSFADFAAFGAEHALTVAKPLHDCQSHGVELLDWERDERTGRCASVLGALTDGYRRPALLQRFLPAVVTGETRLWLLDAKLLCAVRKRPAQGTFRIDMDKGGTLEPCLLSAAEQRKVPLIEALLARQRVRLAAVDLIDGWVTDCNVTSPGLLAQMETVLGANLARPIIETLLGPYGARSVRADGPESDRRHLAAPRSEEASPVDEGRPDQRASSKRPRVDSTSATVSSTGAGRASR